jgi:outer membrane translocation and assembly module TamA
MKIRDRTLDFNDEANWNANEDLLCALEAKYEYEIKAAKANINIYIESSVGIGEHPDLVSAVDSEMTKLAEAEDKLNTLKNNYLG